MTPIRNEVQHRSVLIAFWAFVVIAVVISSSALVLAREGDRTADRVEKAICIEIKFLEGSASANNRLAGDLEASPDETRARQEAFRRALRLASDLRALDIHCPPREE